MNVHCDTRRMLIDWGEGKAWKTCKTVHVYERMSIGDHYHKEKDERFMLVYGSGMKTINGKTSLFNLNDIVDIEAGTKHEFLLEPGSILICLCTKVFTETDDYK